MDESHFAGDCSSEDVPNQKRKRQKPARYQTESDTEIVKSERVTDSDSESANGKRHLTPEVPINNEFDSSTSKTVSILPNLKRKRKKPARYQSESSDPESESNVDDSMNTSHLNGNCSEDVPKQTHKRQKPARHQIELIQVKSERLSDPDSESDSVFDSSKRHELSNLSESNKLGSNNTSRHSSNSEGHVFQGQNGELIPKTELTSQDDVSNYLSSSEMEQAALFGHLFQELEKINRKLDDLHDKIDCLHSKIDQMSHNGSTNISTAFHSLPEDVKLPITSLEELYELNDRLKKDKQLSTNLAGYLFHAGMGKSQRSFLTSLTKRVLARNIAMQFSRFGRKGKMPFINYNETLHVILAAAAMKFKEADREELAEMFGKCLASAIEWNSRKTRPFSN